MTELSIIKQALATTLMLVLLLGGITVFSVIEPPPGLVAHPLNEGIRGPASISSNNIPLASAATVSSNEFILPCSLKEQKLSGYSDQVRIQGDTCKEKLTRITNKTNGFVATIFATTSTHFTTDYISLQPGENKIEVQQTARDGVVTTSTVTLIH
jgi:hypothetical protein